MNKLYKLDPAGQFCFNVARFQTKLSRRLDSRLGGIGFTELIILYYLSQSAEHKMRRIDLAEQIGLTASGITRLLLPMEKIGLIKRESDSNDARVSFVVLASGGQTKLSEGLERLEIFCEELAPANKQQELAQLSELLNELGKNI